MERPIEWITTNITWLLLIYKLLVVFIFAKFNWFMILLVYGGFIQIVSCALFLLSAERIPTAQTRPHL